MSTTASDARIGQLIQQAERAAASGRVNEATRLIAEAARSAPEEPLVLNASAMLALREGNGARARDLLLRAIAGSNRNPAFWINLASANRLLGKLDEEIKALDSALAIEPRNIMALLQKASHLDQAGQPRSAASIYSNALQVVPPGAQVPQFLEPSLRRAAERVRANEAELGSFIAERLQPARQQVSGENLRRFDHCLDTVLGRRAIYRPQPTFMFFPALPAYEFYNREEFPWLDRIEAETEAVRAEFTAVYAEEADRLEPYVQHPEGVPLDQWAELNHSKRWSVYYLWRYGAPLDEKVERCPRTAAIVRSAPLVDVAGNGPNVFFSILEAKSRIPAHTGVTNTRLIVHLPLIVPPDCRFRVGSEVRTWEPGKAWVFDDTIEHEAINDSGAPRAILIFDIWNPYLTNAEQALVREATVAIHDYYGEQGRQLYRS